jgi:hypothetical protein
MILLLPAQCTLSEIKGLPNNVVSACGLQVLTSAPQHADIDWGKVAENVEDADVREEGEEGKVVGACVVVLGGAVVEGEGGEGGGGGGEGERGAGGG